MRQTTTKTKSATERVCANLWTEFSRNLSSSLCFWTSSLSACLGGCTTAATFNWECLKTHKILMIIYCIWMIRGEMNSKKIQTSSQTYPYFISVLPNVVVLIESNVKYVGDIRVTPASKIIFWKYFWSFVCLMQLTLNGAHSLTAYNRKKPPV